MNELCLQSDEQAKLQKEMERDISSVQAMFGEFKAVMGEGMGEFKSHVTEEI